MEVRISIPQTRKTVTICMPHQSDISAMRKTKLAKSSVCRRLLRFS